MNDFHHFMIAVFLAATLSGCTDPADEEAKIKPAQSPPSIVITDDVPAKPPIQNFSKILGHWDILRFDDYEPTRLSSDGKNHAYVTIRDGRLSFRIECNYSGLEAKLTSSGVLESMNPDDGMMATQMGCTPERQARDEQFFSFFNSQPKIVAISASQLRLTTENHELLLEARDNSPSQLNGVWQLRYVDGVNVAYAAMPTPDTARFDYLIFNIKAQDAGVTGYDGCNHGGGRVTFDAQRMTFGRWVSDASRCVEGFQQLSDHYRDALSNDAGYEVDGLHLTIKSKNKAYEFAQLDMPPKPPSVLDIETYAPPPIPLGSGGIRDNPLTRKAEGGDEHFFLNDWGKWQFVDKPDPKFFELGPDYFAGNKPFVNFNPRREMWGQDEGVFFYRRYEFDETSVTFTPDPRRREAATSDGSSKIGNTDSFPQTPFMGRYDMRKDGAILTLTQEAQTIRLEPYVQPAPLPPLADDQPLCEIRDIRPGETFPDHPSSDLPEYSYSVTGSNETLMWDHQGGPQGIVELADGQAVLFKGKDGDKILRKISPYPTSAVFGKHGLYCTYWGADSGRSWPNIVVIDGTQSQATDDVNVESVIVEENNCLRMETKNGERYTPIFSSHEFVGYDDFGVYLKDSGGVKKRIGDRIQSRVSRKIFFYEAYAKETNRFLDSCPSPSRIFKK